MSGGVGASVEVSVIFWQEINIVKYEAIELVHCLTFLESSVHQDTFVEDSTAGLNQHFTTVHQFHSFIST